MGRAVLVPVPERQADGELLLRAFAETQPELVRTLARFLGSDDDAQDVVQDAFIKCWRRRDQTEGIRDLRAWIFRVGLNAARDLQRDTWRRRARPLLAEGTTDDAASPPEQAVHTERLARLRAALAELRPAERDVFLLRQNSALTYEQIATLRGIPVGTAKTLMRAALLRLRHVLQETLPEA